MEVKFPAAIHSIFTASALTSGATAVSDGIDLTNTGGGFGLWYSVSCTGTPHVRLWFEMSYDNNTSHCAYPSNGSDVEADLSNVVPNVQGITPPLMRYIFFKATTLVTSDPNVTFTVKLVRQ